MNTREQNNFRSESKRETHEIKDVGEAVSMLFTDAENNMPVVITFIRQHPGEISEFCDRIKDIADTQNPRLAVDLLKLVIANLAT
ncbi:hypothetical protein HYV70_02265 [Candidatus Uhrbacteria bacterium]|nr:hypothetical protein [Candidatus Uhrbacteria bacterium]